MDAPKLLKLLVFVLVIAALLPFARQWMPKPASVERAVAAFKAAGLEVTDVAQAEYPQLDSIAQTDLLVDGAMVGIYQYGDEGKIVRNLEYRKKDAGTAIVETWNLAQSLGAAPSKNKPEYSGRNGMFMIIATGEDEALLKEIVRIFKTL